MINLYIRNIIYRDYCFGDPIAKLAPHCWSDSILSAIDEYRRAEFNPEHSAFSRRTIIASFDQLPTLDSHPELFL